jgi:hypothetical protein
MCSALEVAGLNVIGASADIAIQMHNSVDDKPAASGDLALDQNVDVPDFPELTALAIVDDRQLCHDYHAHWMEPLMSMIMNTWL